MAVQPEASAFSEAAKCTGVIEEQQPTAEAGGAVGKGCRRIPASSRHDDGRTGKSSLQPTSEASRSEGDDGTEEEETLCAVQYVDDIEFVLNFIDAKLAAEFNFTTLIDVPLPPWRVPLHLWMRGLQVRTAVKKREPCQARR